MISSKEVSSDVVFKFVREECQTIDLKPKTLGMLFEMYAGIEYGNNDETSYFTEKIEISELTKNIHPGFKTSNGNHWARSNQGYLGTKYDIKRPKKDNKTFAVQLDGPNYSLKIYRSINKEIRSSIENQRCVILDVGSNIEIDHKNGKYDNPSMILQEDQEIENFQPLSKAANYAKRQHCKECNDDGKRYDARQLGYKEGWTRGDENTQNCVGCYWYDPKRFNELISEKFNEQK